MGNATINRKWPTCVGCAILHRSFAKTGTAAPEVCNACFTEFCWDGSLDTSDVTYFPELELRVSGSTESQDKTSGAEIWGVHWFKVLAALVVLLIIDI